MPRFCQLENSPSTPLNFHGNLSRRATPYDAPRPFGRAHCPSDRRTPQAPTPLSQRVMSARPAAGRQIGHATRSPPTKGPPLLLPPPRPSLSFLPNFSLQPASALSSFCTLSTAKLFLHHRTLACRSRLLLFVTLLFPILPSSARDASCFPGAPARLLFTLASTAKASSRLPPHHHPIISSCLPPLLCPLPSGLDGCVGSRGPTTNFVVLPRSLASTRLSDARGSP